MKTYYIEWNTDNGHVGKAVVISGDMVDATEKLCSNEPSARYDNIVVVGIIDNLKVLAMEPVT